MTTKETSVHAKSPGAVLRLARESRELSVREVAEQLNWLPAWVKAIEADRYDAVRNIAFARGYVKAYGRLMMVHEGELMQMFDELQPSLRKAQRSGSSASTGGLPVTYLAGTGALLLLAVGLWFVLS